MSCVVAGGGPAGIVCGMLLARAGVDVVVLEKHEDFLRDFRGDTLHPSTLRMLDEIPSGAGTLADDVLALPHARVQRLRVSTDAGEATIGDFARIPGRFPFLALLPQWDLLDLLARRAAENPRFTLRTGAEVLGLLEDSGRVRGIRYRAGGCEHDLLADLVIAADGRNSVLRAAAGLPLRVLGSPIDVLWFRLPHPGGGLATFARLSAGGFLVVLDRGDYLQVAHVVAKGGWAAVRDAGAPALRARLVALLPALAPVVGGLDLDDVRVLDVRIDRLTRWHRPGFLAIGDAAHAMSPVGGVGVNLAVQDAVATARLLAPVLRRGRPTGRDLARVRRRRWLPTVLTQSAQRVAQARVVAPAATGTAAPRTRLPLPLRMLQSVPVLQGLPARAVGLGVLREHPPAAHP